jgi:CDP-diacylglycerol---glycerol-3-phosphate 3-phosphatidyltransferase
MKPIAKQAFWNIPNSLTVARCAAVPFVAFLLVFTGYWWNLVACIVFVVASITDLVDGYLARRLDLESTIGAFLDPLADKLLVMTCMIMLVPLDRIPAWMVVIFLAREISVTALRGIAASEGIIIAAGSLGKYKTAFQTVALGFLIYHWNEFGVNVHSVGIVLMWIALVYALASGYKYLMGFVRATVIL